MNQLTGNYMGIMTAAEARTVLASMDFKGHPFYGDLTYRRIVELVHNSINDETPKNITY